MTNACEARNPNSESPHKECLQTSEETKTHKNCRHNVKYECDVQESVAILMEHLLGFGKEGNVVDCGILIGLGEGVLDLVEGLKFRWRKILARRK